MCVCVCVCVCMCRHLWDQYGGSEICIAQSLNLYIKSLRRDPPVSFYRK